MFFIPSLLLNAGFFSIFSIVRINRILCAASIWSPHLYSVFCWYCHYNKFIFHNTHLPWGIASLYFSNFENSVFIFSLHELFFIYADSFIISISEQYHRLLVTIQKVVSRARCFGMFFANIQRYTSQNAITEGDLREQRVKVRACTEPWGVPR